jgi:hypothetical protein
MQQPPNRAATMFHAQANESQEYHRVGDFSAKPTPARVFLRAFTPAPASLHRFIHSLCG